MCVSCLSMCGAVSSISLCLLRLTLFCCFFFAIFLNNQFIVNGDSVIDPYVYMKYSISYRRHLFFCCCRFGSVHLGIKDEISLHVISCCFQVSPTSSRTNENRYNRKKRLKCTSIDATLLPLLLTLTPFVEPFYRLMQYAPHHSALHLSNGWVYDGACEMVQLLGGIRCRRPHYAVGTNIAPCMYVTQRSAMCLVSVIDRRISFTST